MKGINNNLDDPYLSVLEGITTDTSLTTDHEGDFARNSTSNDKPNTEKAGVKSSGDEEGGVQSSDNEDASSESKAAEAGL